MRHGSCSPDDTFIGQYGATAGLSGRGGGKRPSQIERLPREAAVH